MHIFSLVTHYRPNRSKLLIPCIVLSYIVIVPDPSIRDIVRPVHRDRPASLPPAIMPVATLANADIVVARYLLERPLLPPPLPHSWDFSPACGQKESVGIELPPSSRSKSRWSRHTGQCYSSVSFLQFFLCTLLPLSLRLFFLYLPFLPLRHSQYDPLYRNTNRRPSVSIIFYEHNGGRETRGLARSRCS